MAAPDHILFPRHRHRDLGTIRALTMLKGAGKAHGFRLVLCGHKAVEAGAVCLVLMVGGHLGDVTAAHLVIATKTGLLAVSAPVALTFTRYARLLANMWTAAVILGTCTF